MDIRESYDSAAEAYAEHLFDELAHKPLDRDLLTRFAEEVRGRGLVADLGCGPGHIGRYLSKAGVEILGIDISPRMIACATRLNPCLRFEVGDMMNLALADQSLAGAVAFYSIVHFAPDHLVDVFAETRRVIRTGGVVLLAFHIGENVMHADVFFGARVSLDFYFHPPTTVITALEAAGLEPIEQFEREPYDASIEYPSRRCYLLARAV